MLSNSTVPKRYESPHLNGSSHFKTNKEIESELISLLQQQGYEYIEIEQEEELKKNLRTQLERLNSSKRSKEFKFSDSEWNWFFQEYFERKTIEEVTSTIQKDWIKNLKQEGDKWTNVYLIDKDNVHRNCLQVLKAPQKKEQGGRRDLIILVNGIPMVFLELKESWERLESAFRRLERYDKYEYLSGYFKLFWFIQLFVMSKYSETKYFSNTSNLAWVKRAQGDRGGNPNFRLTSYWSDSENNRIENLIDFAKHFLNKTHLLNILTKYCVFTTDKKLIVMRPYQICAVEEMVKKVKTGIEEKLEGHPDARGYIWHATGSGKTLTSYKARELISRIEGISKVLFVVDRRVLDSQTQREFHRFGEEKHSSTTSSTCELIEKLKDTSCRAITTTFQKLNKACGREGFMELPILKERVVFIFDECHRSQGDDDEMGTMRRVIENRFKRSFIFGVSGTPILRSKEEGEDKIALGTEKYFSKCLSAYTLLHALKDNNVLGWRYDEAGYKGLSRYDLESSSPQFKLQAKQKKVDWVLENFAAKTKRFKTEKYFNSLFVASSIDDLLEYYEIFKEKKGDDLIVTAIFSISPEEEGSGKGNVGSLSKIIKDYNKTFGTSFDLTSELRKSYEAWREDLTLKLREVKIDILLVVDMFLTGFDSAALNTLWIDKKMTGEHELIQVFSRTNRIHSELKDAGNIVSFVSLSEIRDSALKTYAGDADFDEFKKVILEPDFQEQFEEGKRFIDGFKQKHKDKKIDDSEEGVTDFVRDCGEALSIHEKLSSYSEYRGQELLNEDEKENYKAKYLKGKEVLDKIRAVRTIELEGDGWIGEEIDNFPFELIRSEDVDLHYILKLILEGEEKDKIMQKVHSNTKMRDFATLIETFYDEWQEQEKDNSTSIDQDWSDYIERIKDQELDEGMKECRLKPEKREEIKEVVDKGDSDKVLHGIWLRSVMENLSYRNKESYTSRQKARDFLLALIAKWKKYKI